jgi:predicted dehydrogenase
MRYINLFLLISLFTCFSGCTGGNQKTSESKNDETMFSGEKNEVKIMTLNPGHFHAALVQKSMYEQVDPKVFVYAPEGQDVRDHLKRIDGFNMRTENPTSWIEEVYTGPDYLEKMIADRKGNVMMASGKNSSKTEYIKKAVDAGINVFADKPMAIDAGDYLMLKEAFKIAEEKGILIYDIMTERFEITTIIQRELSQIEKVFGSLENGTPEEPAITKESVHHFFKYVSGNALIRPDWFFDTGQQGEGIVDVTTHLVDLIQWEAFPEQIIGVEDVELVTARHWTTDLSIEMFSKVTGLDAYPDFLRKDVVDDILKVYSNGEIVYKINGIHAKASVIWNYQAPEGTGDTHYSIMRGTSCDLIIRQGMDEGFKPILYIELKPGINPESFEIELQNAIDTDISGKYPGVKLLKISESSWSVDIPDKYKIGHEAHFEQVTKNYLQYLKDGKLPEWEVPNMITKYYLTTEALKLAVE